MKVVPPPLSNGLFSWPYIVILKTVLRGRLPTHNSELWAKKANLGGSKNPDFFKYCVLTFFLPEKYTIVLILKIKLIIPPFQRHLAEGSGIYDLGVKSVTSWVPWVKMAPLWISKSKRATYENFCIFGFSIVENLGYMPVLKTFENFLGIVQSL